MSNIEGKPKAQNDETSCQHYLVVPTFIIDSSFGFRHLGCALFTAGNHLSFTLSRLFSRPDRERGGASFHLVLRLRD